MSSQSAIFHASSDGPSTFASSATRQSCKSAWRFRHQSTSSRRHWTSRPPFNSSSSWRSTDRRQSCKRVLAWRQRPKLRSPARRRHQPRRQTPWELVATPSPSWWNRRKLSLSSSLTMSTQLRWVVQCHFHHSVVQVMKRISSPEELCIESKRFLWHCSYRVRNLTDW